MNPKDSFRIFRAASWQGAAEVQQFVDACAEIQAQTLQQFLQVLVDRRMATQGREHALRCAVFRRVCEAGARREMFTPIVRVLKHADPVAKQSFVELLPTINSVSGHREVVQLFRSNDLELRRCGRDIMAKVGGKTAFGMLTELCAEPQFPGRIEAIEAMVSLAGYHAIPALHATIVHGTTEEKLQSLEFLGNDEVITKNRQGALEGIALSIEDMNDQVVFAGIEAFGQLADEDDFVRYVIPKLESGNLAIVKAVVRAMRRYISPRILGVLAQQLRLGPKSVRIEVLEALEAMEHEDVLPIVAQALDHRQIAVRLRAADVLKNLAESGKVDIARTIVWLLRSRDIDVKRIAADLAKRVGDPDGTLWPQLLRYLRDEDWWVRERITDALVDMAGRQLTHHAVGFLEDDSAILRRYAVELLMRIGDPGSLGALVRTAGEDEDWWVAERAVEAIGALGDARAVPYVVDFMQREVELRAVCMETLAQLGDPSAAQAVADLIEVLEDDMIPMAIDVLGRLNDPAQSEAIVHFAESEDFDIRRAARELLQRWQIDAQFKDWAADENSRLSTLDRLLWATAKAGGDDLLLGSDRRPYIKKLGEVVPIVRNVFSAEQVQGLIFPHLTRVQIEMLHRGDDVDFSYEVKAARLRFRVNVFRDQSGLSSVFRIVKNQIPAMEQLGLPPLIREFGDLRNGLVLVGGPTGSGKSTTLAALIDYINRTYDKHIITLEDPIEVLHEPKRSLINQRELGTHTTEFREALRSTLREDPDVILVGEMRDLDTISFAISAAETGHLVFGTVHTASADNSVDRIINAFPFGQQPQVRTILASSLRAVVCQYLVPRKDGKGRIPSVEIMLNNEAVSNLIRTGKSYQIPNIISVSRETGMQSMDMELARLFQAGLISADEGYMRAVNKKDFEAIVIEVEGEVHERFDADVPSLGSATAAGQPPQMPARQGEGEEAEEEGPKFGRPKGIDTQRNPST